jgi:alginate O-acetyltransferase complex protein AlgI
MIFNTFAYFVLFLVPAAILFRLVRPAAQPWVCGAFGAGFFVFFSLTQIGGVAGAFCLLIFIWESIFSRFYKKGSRLCFIGIGQAILFLMVFKYWNFLTGLFFAPTGHNPLSWSGAFLPLGISFFTFEFIHYAVDRYRGVTPAGKFGEYMAFILFFPTMVAGPIKRYQDFRPKLAQPSLVWDRDWEMAITRILAGLAKKFVVADLLTAFTNHLNRTDIAHAARWMLPCWLLAYGMKIYFDFSAYSDIAIGSARLFGIKVPENFDWPYLRTNISEFWQHWHMSLYKWLVDYVFIPLGGSRTSRPRVYLNVLITMFVSGLWHGAGLNFVVWGLWHGMLLAIYRLWSNWRKPMGAASLPMNRQPRRTNGLLSPALSSPGGGEGENTCAPSVQGPSAHQRTSGLPTDNQPTGIYQPGLVRPPTSAHAPPDSSTLLGKIAGWALTFFTVNIGWAFFCMDLPTAVAFFKRLFLG